MRVAISKFAFICCLFLLQVISTGQVIVNCPDGDFGRCVPNEESSLDSWTISPCDCDHPKNNLALGLCYRKITLHTDNPITPIDITAFRHPYFDLDPKMFNMRGPNGNHLVYFLDPNGIISPDYTDDFPNEAALILEIIEENDNNATFDAWVPFGEEAYFRVYDEVDNSTSRDYHNIGIEADQCNKTIKRCFTFQSEAPQVISIINNYDFNIPIMDASNVDFNINNIDISLDANEMNLLDIQIANEFETRTLYTIDYCNDLNSTLNIGFDDTAQAIDCQPTSGQIYQPFEGLADFDIFYDVENFGLSPYLRIRNKDAVAPLLQGTLNSWEIEVCPITPVCDAYNSYTSDGPCCDEIDTGLPNTITSSIFIVEEGLINNVTVENLDIEHTWVGDLRITLKSPLGTEVLLHNRACGDVDNINIGFQDSSDTLATTLCNLDRAYLHLEPFDLLSAFIGEEASGTWTLIIEDLADQDGGRLNFWDLNICTSCAPDYDLTGINSSSNFYYTDGTITSTETIDNFNSPNQNIALYSAAEYILLEKGFEVVKGSELVAYNDGCETN